MAQSIKIKRRGLAALFRSLNAKQSQGEIYGTLRKAKEKIDAENSSADNAKTKA